MRVRAVRRLEQRYVGNFEALTSAGSHGAYLVVVLSGCVATLGAPRKEVARESR